MVLESRGDVLMLPTVSRKDSGIYQCRPLDSVGQAVKGEVQLTVHCTLEDHSSSYTRINDSVVFISFKVQPFMLDLDGRGVTNLLELIYQVLFNLWFRLNAFIPAQNVYV